MFKKITLFIFFAYLLTGFTNPSIAMMEEAGGKALSRASHHRMLVFSRGDIPSLGEEKVEPMLFSEKEAEILGSLTYRYMFAHIFCVEQDGCGAERAVYTDKDILDSIAKSKLPASFIISVITEARASVDAADMFASTSAADILPDVYRARDIRRARTYAEEGDIGACFAVAFLNLMIVTESKLKAKDCSNYVKEKTKIMDFSVRNLQRIVLNEEMGDLLAVSILQEISLKRSISANQAVTMIPAKKIQAAAFEEGLNIVSVEASFVASFKGTEETSRKKSVNPRKVSSFLTKSLQIPASLLDRDGERLRYYSLKFLHLLGDPSLSKLVSKALEKDIKRGASRDDIAYIVRSFPEVLIGSPLQGIFKTLPFKELLRDIQICIPSQEIRIKSEEDVSYYSNFDYLGKICVRFQDLEKLRDLLSFLIEEKHTVSLTLEGVDDMARLDEVISFLPCSFIYINLIFAPDFLDSTVSLFSFSEKFLRRSEESRITFCSSSKDSVVPSDKMDWEKIQGYMIKNLKSRGFDTNTCFEFMSFE